MNPGRRHATRLVAATGNALLPQLNLLDQDAVERLQAVALARKSFIPILWQESS